MPIDLSALSRKLVSRFVNGDAKDKEERTCLYFPGPVIGLRTVGMKSIEKLFLFTEARK